MKGGTALRMFEIVEGEGDDGLRPLRAVVEMDVCLIAADCDDPTVVLPVGRTYVRTDRELARPVDAATREPDRAREEDVEIGRELALALRRGTDLPSDIERVLDLLRP